MSLQSLTPHRLTKLFHIAAAHALGLTVMFLSPPTEVLLLKTHPGGRGRQMLKRLFTYFKGRYPRATDT